MYANPLPGTIHPKGWVRPAGNIEFAVTRTCADHKATNQGCALDIWNGRADGKVLAIAGGRVIYRNDLEGIIRIDHGNGDVSGYAHMFPVLVTVGTTVATGRQIGEVGDAHSASIPNFSGPHLHFAIARAGVEIDPWPLLDQNTGGDDLTEITITPAPGTCFIAAGATVDGWNAQQLVKRQTWPTASNFPADALVTIKQVPQKAPNGTFRRCTAGVYAGLFIPIGQVSFTATPAPPAGFTQADLDKAAMDAKVPAAKAAAEATAKAAVDFAASLPKP